MRAVATSRETQATWVGTIAAVSGATWPAPGTMSATTQLGAKGDVKQSTTEANSAPIPWTHRLTPGAVRSMDPLGTTTEATKALTPVCSPTPLVAGVMAPTAEVVGALSLVGVPGVAKRDAGAKIAAPVPRAPRPAPG